MLKERVGVAEAGLGRLSHPIYFAALQPDVRKVSDLPVKVISPGAVP